MPEKVGDFAVWLEAYLKRYKVSTATIAGLLGTTEKTVNEWRKGRGPDHPKAIQDSLTARYTLMRVRIERLLLSADKSEQARRALDKIVHQLEAAEQEEGLT